jgi:hypothetical protein
MPIIGILLKGAFAIMAIYFTTRIVLAVISWWYTTG